ncbi:putative gamma-glutamylcyclotransferase CG2811 isoform X2 [Folsomia candida]|uniref:Gamma-glutamylcyclotransferase family protein n=1 Tax=Folsomia candida TaxID=158441 RepID=A0A226EV98_FOLCA|nr:putative gamma-glutamylcyclotransferase CG2811 isoform X2 [Folsomia candida]OXA61140.1 Gamma-glutamylaminecyclotransferase C [Folsomia candida]
MFVFVYGTLKFGEPNHHWLTDPAHGFAKFVGEGTTKQLYPLVIASKYNIPFLLDSPRTGKHIRGEVYEIDDKMLANLDILEEYPKLYTRREEEIDLHCDNEGTSRVVQAVAYFLSNFQPTLLERPHLDCYQSEGTHNLPYIASEDDLADAKDI